MGRGTPHVSAAPGDPLAHAPSLRYRRLGTADLRAGPQPVTRGSGGHRSVGGAPSVAGPSRPWQKVRKQLPGLAALVDFWWQGVEQDLEPFGLSPMWQSWVHEGLLPLVYWEHHVAHTRCARRKAKIRACPGGGTRRVDTRMPSPSSWPLACLRNGKRGPPSGRRSFSGPHRPWKGAMAICRKCITTIAACPSTDTRCGPFCTTLIVALQMVRRQRLVFSGERFRTFLKQCYPTSMPCLSRGDENTM